MKNRLGLSIWVRRSTWHPNQECFSSYTTDDYSYVKMGNDGACQIVGIREVCLLTSTRCRMILKEVHHVPDIWLNFKSVGRLVDEGYSGNFRNGTWKFYKGNLIVAHAWKHNTWYVMHAHLSRNKVNMAADTTGELWHKMLCHMTQEGHADASRKRTPAEGEKREHGQMRRLLGQQVEHGCLPP